jgi:hypothetical protein
MQIIIYTLNDMLFIHTLYLIKVGKILIMNKEGEMISNHKLFNADFFSCRLPAGGKEYLVRVETGSEIFLKKVFVNRKTEKEERKSFCKPKNI